MPRLPTAADFGGRAAPSPSQQVASIPGLRADRTGGILSEVGDMVAREVDALESLAAEDALNKLREKRVELTVGPGKGFQHVTGGAVIARPVLDEFPAAFSKASEDLAKGLSSGARKKFQAHAGRESLGYRTDLMRHVAAQTESFRSDVFKATVEVEASYAAARWSDPLAVQASLQRVEQATAAETTRQGMEGPDAAKLQELFVKQNSGAVVISAIRGALAGDDSVTAEAYFKQFEDKLTAQQRDAVRPMLKSAAAWTKGQDLGQQAFQMQRTGKSQVQVEKFLQDSTKGAKDAYSNASMVWNQLQGALKAQQGAAADEAQNRINRGEPWAKIRSQYLDSADPGVVAAFDKREQAGAGTGKEVKTDFGVWYDLKTRIDSGEEVDLRGYVDRISTGDLKTLATSKDKDLKDLQTMTQQLGTAHKLMGLGSKKSDLEKKGAFDAFVTEEIHRQETEGKKRLSYEERKAVIERGMEVTRDDWWAPTQRRYQTAPTVDAAPVEEKPTTRSALSVLIQDPGPEARALGMTPAERTQIVRQYRQVRQGALPTEDEIVRIYKKLKGE